MDPYLEPAKIDFCDILNNNGIQCPQEEETKDICITIWRNETPTMIYGTLFENWFDRLCSKFIIRTNAKANSRQMRMFYEDDDDSYEYNSFFSDQPGVFALNACPQFNGIDGNRANLPSSWDSKYEDYWYVRFAVVDHVDNIATHD